MLKLNVMITRPDGRQLFCGEIFTTTPDARGSIQGSFRYTKEYLSHPDAFSLDPVHLPLGTAETILCCCGAIIYRCGVTGRRAAAFIYLFIALIRQLSFDQEHGTGHFSNQFPNVITHEQMFKITLLMGCHDHQVNIFF